MSGRVLVVDDDSAQCDLLRDGLTRRGFAVTTRAWAEEALALLQTDDFDVIVTDLNMRGMSGLELCERVAANRPGIAVLLITAFGSLDTAVAAIRAGAYDFITKPFDIDALRLAIERAVRHRELSAEVTRLRRLVRHSDRFKELIGASPTMERVYDLLDRVAETDASVLVTGESGTGKELVARAIHQRGRRHAGPFVALNCAAVTETLLESELFGHAKGAFTDAKHSRDGLFVEANGGTLFLDEIGELPLGLQPKLLRALQERKVRPVGGNTEVPFDARVVTATNRDLETAVEEGRFRGDLFYRINVVHVAVPPLRARGTDVLLLAQHFLEHFAQSFGKRVDGLSSAVAERLLAYSWPGNVRELGNCIERAIALTRFSELVVEDLPERVQSYRQSHVAVSSFDAAELVPLEEIERRYIMRVLEAVGGNRTVAAQTLGLDRKTLYRKLKAYGGPDERVDAPATPRGQVA
ncbi:MAG TPA: sigma-54 dependent transcriptional regulator [Polyangiaceae bacterium]|jgi:two-component system response regulator HydG|nr:sigma-54 dependent transcriptional regulator [Polyangiaceae bacterium]